MEAKYLLFLLLFLSPLMVALPLSVLMIGLLNTVAVFLVCTVCLCFIIVAAASLIAQFN